MIERVAAEPLRLGRFDERQVDERGLTSAHSPPTALRAKKTLDVNATSAFFLSNRQSRANDFPFHHRQLLPKVAAGKILRLSSSLSKHTPYDLCFRGYDFHGHPWVARLQPHHVADLHFRPTPPLSFTTARRGVPALWTVRFEGAIRALVSGTHTWPGFFIWTGPMGASPLTAVERSA
jgi:hypothetical protein